MNMAVFPLERKTLGATIGILKPNDDWKDWAIRQMGRYESWALIQYDDRITGYWDSHNKDKTVLSL